MKKINQTLSELMVGILASGVLVWLISMIFTGPDAAFAGAFGTGVAAAVLLAVHMYRSIDRALDMDSGDAEKYMRRAYLIRTLFIFLVAGVVCRINADDIIAVFLGMLCLKFGAFLQPMVHRVLGKGNKKK